MIRGVGTDILRFDKLQATCADEGDPFVRRAFTEKEREEAGKRPDRISYYASRYAGKEAVFKALRISPKAVDLSEIEILNDGNGAPYVRLYGYLKHFTETNGIRIAVSLSYEEEETIAYAVAEEVREAAY